MRNLTIIILNCILSLLIFSGCDEQKPSICDCNAVMLRTDSTYGAVERIMDEDAKYITGDPIDRAQRKCASAYFDEIVKYQKEKGLPGTYQDNALGYFADMCK